MRGFECRIQMVGFCALVAGLAGCIEAKEASTGSIDVNLVGQSASGRSYRLREAMITVEGAGASQIWNTEDDPDRTALSANVPVGDYTATVAPGWHLERIGNGGPVTISAELTSANPAPFAVALHQRTTVPLHFRVGGEDVDFTQGYDIVVTVEEPPSPVAIVAIGGDRTVPAGLAVYPFDATGDVTPLRTITGPSTTLNVPTGVLVSGDEIIVCDVAANAVDVFPLGADGDVAPVRRIAGATTTLDLPVAAAVSGGELFVDDARGRVLVFPLDASGDVAPIRSFNGPGSRASRVIAIDGGEIYMDEAFTGSIDVFPRGASGTVVPTRSITPVDFVCPDGLVVVGGELFSLDPCANQIRVYAATASGLALPVRVIGNAVEPIMGGGLALFRNELYVSDVIARSLAVFPVTGHGNLIPTRLITGPHTSLINNRGAFVAQH